MREIGGDIGQNVVGAFQSAKNAVGEFMKTGKLKVGDLVSSLIADLARLAARGPKPFPIPAYSRTGARQARARCWPRAQGMMIEVTLAAAGPGALVLFRMKPRAVAKHVGNLIGPDTFLHSYERLGVIEEPLTQSWRRPIAFAFLFPHR